MKKKITLSQIGLYNPQRVNDEIAEALFVAREQQFGFLMERIKKESPDSIPQHYLIIAQRGMGKTTLLKRIEVELRKKTYNSAFIPVLFPEEQYNLKNLAEFWLNSLDALADTLELENKESEVGQIDARVKELMQINDNENLAKEAYRFFKQFSLSIQRRPVLLIDNMNLIFDRLDSAEQYTLRAWITENKAPILIGANTTLSEGTTSYQAPFYDAFQILYLNKLSFEELLKILKNLSILTHESGILSDIEQKSGRLKTLHQLTGGNPRTTVMLFKLIVKGFSKEINDDLEGLLDEATPIYKARFEELSLQMQVIVDAIALNWDPINLEQLRQATRYENNQLSPQLKRLVEIGWIEKVDAYQSKGSAYQISERFFNIWFLMRRSSRRQKREIYCLSKFLEVFYGEELGDLAEKQLKCKSTCDNHIAYTLAIAEAIKDDLLKNQLQKKSLRELYEFSLKDPQILERFDVSYRYHGYTLSELIKQIGIEFINENYSESLSLLYEVKDILPEIKEKADLYCIEGRILTLQNKIDQAITAYQKALKLDKKNTESWFHLAEIYHTILKQYQNAENAYKKAISLNKTNEYYWFKLGTLYIENSAAPGNHIKAEKAFLRAHTLKEKDDITLGILGFLYLEHFQDYNRAEKEFLQAIALNPNSSQHQCGLGHVYREQKKYDRAEQAFQKAVQIAPQKDDYWYLLGNLYQSHLNRYQKAEECYKKAIELNPQDKYYWHSLGYLYENNQKDYPKAEEAYKKAIAVDNTESYDIKSNLFCLYLEKINNLQKAEELFNTIQPDHADDRYWLDKALLELHKRNEGLAKENLLKAFGCIQSGLPSDSQAYWWYFGAIATKLQYGNWLLSILEENGYDSILAPYYVALKYMNAKDPEGYLNSKAVEIKEPAMKLIKIMKEFIQ